MERTFSLASAALIATLTFSSIASAETGGEGNQVQNGFFSNINGEYREVMASIRAEFLEARAKILELWSTARDDPAAREEIRSQVRELRQQARTARNAARAEARGTVHSERAGAIAAKAGARAERANAIALKAGERAERATAHSERAGTNAEKAGARAERTKARAAWMLAHGASQGELAGNSLALEQGQVNDDGAAVVENGPGQNNGRRAHGQNIRRSRGENGQDVQPRTWRNGPSSRSF